MQSSYALHKNRMFCFDPWYETTTTLLEKTEK